MKLTNKKKGPGRAHRKGISLVELFKMFPDEPMAMQWFEDQRWPRGRRCSRCDSDQTSNSSHKTMPYRCRKCRKFFSVRVGTVLEGSNLGYREWAIAIYMVTTSLKGVFSMKLHRDLGITQKSAWHLMQRIRKGFEDNTDLELNGPVEVDEAFVGGIEANKPEHKKLRAGRGTVGKKAVVGLKDRQTKEIRAQVVPDTTSLTLQGFVNGNVKADAVKYTDENRAYSGMPNRLAAFALCRTVGRREGPHQRHGKLLVHAETRISWHLPQDEFQTPASLCGRVRRSAQHQR